jgi:hypothetical protein
MNVGKAIFGVFCGGFIRIIFGQDCAHNFSSTTGVSTVFCLINIVLLLWVCVSFTIKKKVISVFHSPKKAAIGQQQMSVACQNSQTYKQPKNEIQRKIKKINIVGLSLALTKIVF